VQRQVAAPGRAGWGGAWRLGSRCLGLSVIGLLVGASALAAPGDALLGGLPEGGQERGWLSLSADHADRSLNPFQDRVVDPSAPQLPPGSVDGQQLAGAWRVREDLLLSAALGQRRLDDGLDRYRFDSWLLSGQFRLTGRQTGRQTGPADGWHSLSLRLAAWGHQADVMASRTPVQVPGAVLNSVTVISPSDRNLQADLVASWQLQPAVEVHAVLSLGRTQLAYGDLRATTTLDGCQYDLDFQGNDIFGNLSAPCSAAGGVVQQFFDSSGDYGVDVPRELAWRGHFVQAGVNMRWQRGDWSLQGGYLAHRIWRQDVDDILAARGDPVQTINHLVAVEAGWRVHRHLALFLRGQRSSRLFFNELPVIYNSSTSSSFSQHFSLLTLGLRAHF